MSVNKRDRNVMGVITGVAGTMPLRKEMLAVLLVRRVTVPRTKAQAAALWQSPFPSRACGLYGPSLARRSLRTLTLAYAPTANALP